MAKIEDTECDQDLMKNSDVISFKELLQNSRMKLTEFCNYFGVPYRTGQNWKAGLRECPLYLIDLMRYKLEKEGIIK